MLMNIVVSWDWLTYAPVTDVTQSWFSLSSPTPVNWLSNAIFFTFVLATPFALYTLNMHGFRPAITTASALVFVGNWVRYASAQHKSFAGVMVGQVLIGLAQPFVLSSATYYSDLWFTSRSRVSATALASLSNPFGAALGQLVNPMIAQHAAQVPKMTLAVALIASVAAAPWAFVPARPPLPPCASASEAKMSVTSALRAVFTNRGFVLIFILVIFFWFGGREQCWTGAD
jgi:MFS family permease